MPGPVNTPIPAVATAVTTSAATELVIVTSNPVNIDVPQLVVLMSFDVDFLNSASGATITFKVKRGTTTGGTLISSANTWGPFTLAASTRYQFGFTCYDEPGPGSGYQYVVTGTIASNAATSTYETAVLTVQCQQAS